MKTSDIERNETRKSHESTAEQTTNTNTRTNCKLGKTFDRQPCNCNQEGLCVLQQSQSCVSLHRKSGDEDVWPAIERASKQHLYVHLVRPRMDGRSSLRPIGSWGPRLNDVRVGIVGFFLSLTRHLQIH